MDQETAFQTLKQKLKSTPILTSPIDNRTYVLDSNASSIRLGVVLQQYQADELKVIAYGSQCLSPAEKTYDVTHRELLAVIYAFKQFRQFLLSRKFFYELIILF